jgi:ABC-type nitrate/sulfonate/bicarbonate transport system substrate-binding protein
LQTVTPKTLIIGFIPLLDCASLVVAVEKGFAATEGLNIALVRETSWANIRDRLIVGHFDAAHMLGPMPLASTLGIGHLKVPLIAPYSMGLGGNAITVSTLLWEQIQDHGAVPGGDPMLQVTALSKVVRERQALDLPPLTLGMVYPFSCHNYELRYWLAAGGIDPDRDVRLVVIPPPLLVDAMREGQVDGYCVGEPWNSLAVTAGVGCIATTTSAIWRHSPEKVLACRADWAERNRERLSALLRAMYRASQWCDRTDNHAELAEILAEPRYVGVAPEILRLGLSGQLLCERQGTFISAPDFLVFARQNATFPWASHAAWFYSQMVRWGQIPASDAQAKTACAAYRPDLYRRALHAMYGTQVELPEQDTKIDSFGKHGGFFDRRSFDAAHLAAYVAGFSPRPEIAAAI